MLSSTTEFDSGLKDVLQALIDKERRLVELETLLRVSESQHFGPGGSDGQLVDKNQYLSGDVEEFDEIAHSKLQTSYNDKDPCRLPASVLSTERQAYKGLLRPVSGGIETSPQEISLLTSPVQVYSGLDLSNIPIPDERIAELASLVQSIYAASLSASGMANVQKQQPTPMASTATMIPTRKPMFGSVGTTTVAPVMVAPTLPSFKVLSLRNCSLDKGGVSCLLDIFKRFPRLEGVILEDNTLGGKAGLGSLLEVVCRVPNLSHLGISLSESPALPFPLEEEPYPPSVQRELERNRVRENRSRRNGRSSSPSKRMAPGSRVRAKDQSTTSIQGTVLHLVSLLRNHASAASISLGGSTLPREALIQFLTAFQPPNPDAPVPEKAKGRSVSTRGRATSRLRGKDANPVRKLSYHPIKSLSLARTHISAAHLMDLALALSPLPTLEDPASKIGLLSAAYPNGLEQGAIVPGIVDPNMYCRPGLMIGVHSSLRFLRVLNLSSCGITSHGLLPVLEAVAHHTLFLSQLILCDNAIDDQGAVAIAQALRVNHQRINDMLDTVDNDSEFVKECSNVNISPLFSSMVRVVDLRNNPLLLSVSNSEHPGCQALLHCIQNLPALLTLTGPAPSVTGLLQLQSKTPMNEMGFNPSYLFDLSAMANTAREIMSGFTPDFKPSGLHMPGRLAHAIAAATLEKLRILSGTKDEEIQEPSRSQGSDTPEELDSPKAGSDSNTPMLLWHLSRPISVQIITKPLVSSPLALGQSGAHILSAAVTRYLLEAQLMMEENKNENVTPQSLPQELAYTHSPSIFGRKVLTVPLLSGSLLSTLPRRDPKLPWQVQRPRIVLEWKSSILNYANQAFHFHLQTIVWHFIMYGPGGRPCIPIASLRHSEGSRDRLHARSLPVDANPFQTMSKATSVPDSTNWKSNAGLDFPRPLGKHEELFAGIHQLTPNLISRTMIAAKADVSALPSTWHSLEIPSQFHNLSGHWTLALHVEVVQPTTQGVTSSTAQPGALSVHVIEAELLDIGRKDAWQLRSDMASPSMNLLSAGINELEEIGPALVHKTSPYDTLEFSFD